MKKLLAFITIASLSLSSAVFVLADEVDGEPAVEEGAEEEAAAEEEEAEEVAEEEEEVAEEEVAAPVVEEVTPVPLKYTEGLIYDTNQQIIGTYPVLTDNKSFSDELYHKLYFAIPELDILYGFAVDNNENNAHQYFSYEVDETLPTAAKIVVSLTVPQPGDVSQLVTSEYAVYYINTVTSAEMTEAEYEALIVPEVEEVEEEAEEEVEEVEEVVEPAEPVMVPIRAHAEALGYTVTWNEAGSVEISKDADTTVITLEQNAYTTFAGEAVELDAAPVFIEGTVYVPVTFFAEILGANVVIAADGTAIITAGAAVVAPAEEATEGEEGAEAPVEEGEAEAPAEEETEGPAEEETEGEAETEE